MASITINLQKKNVSGQAKGQYESFVGITQSGTEIIMDPPSGWVVKDINVYDLGSTQPPSNEKQRDINSLQPNNADWPLVFSRAKPPGVSQGASPSVIVDAGAPGESYEYLVWIQADGDATDNDFVDPGFKNTF